MMLDEIRRSDKELLTPAEVARALGTSAHSIRVAARQRPELLRFPVVVIGTRTKIPRLPLLRFLGVEI